MSTDNLDALKAKAKAATPGPWTFTDYEGSTHIWCGRHMSSMVADNYTEGAVARVRGFGAGLPIVENAAFIAACDPTTVLALLARLKAAEEAADEFAGALSDYGDPNEERTKDAYAWCARRRM